MVKSEDYCVDHPLVVQPESCSSNSLQLNLSHVVMIVFFVLYLVSNNFLYQLYAAQSVCRLSGELSNEVLAVVAPELNNNRLCAYVATGSYLPSM